MQSHLHNFNPSEQSQGDGMSWLILGRPRKHKKVCRPWSYSFTKQERNKSNDTKKQPAAARDDLRLCAANGLMMTHKTQSNIARTCIADT